VTKWSLKDPSIINIFYRQLKHISRNMFLIILAVCALKVSFLDIVYRLGLLPLGRTDLFRFAAGRTENISWTYRVRMDKYCIQLRRKCISYIQ